MSLPALPRPSAVTRALERHYTAEEVAALWQVSVDTVRRMFAGEPGVMDVSRPLGRSKRRYRVLRIPQSVLDRVHRSREVA